ncbi:FG-GAP-like repeat-containing protein [Polymorphospora sp. NPDC050346]|uniref:FG-GAP-like repeat-containing protein n=1 Tax=Polymorphospora sp. NPDC050346 TaxID=3155780 RepID=UPI0034035A25
MRGGRVLGGVLAAAVAGAVMTAAPAAWAGWQGDPLFGDVDGDHVTDRVTLAGGGPDECGVTVELGTGGGGYGPGTVHGYPDPSGGGGHCPDMGVVVDLGGDGTVELVLAWFDGRPPGVTHDLLVLRDYAPAGGFDAIFQPSYIGLADFNGDGRQDVYEWTDQGDGFRTFLNTEAGTLVPGPVEYCGGQPDFELADFDGNGATDVVIAFYEGWCGPFSGVVVVLDDGSTRYLEQDEWGDDGWEVDLVDLDGNGRPDVQTTNWSGTVRLFVNNGDGTFTPGIRAVEDRVTVGPTNRKRINVLDNDVVVPGTVLTVTTPPKYGTATVTAQNTIAYVRTDTSHDKRDIFGYRITSGAQTSDATIIVRVKK